MHKRCPVCDLDYEREIGFYYGAMYVSYALAIALGVGLYILLVLLLSLDPVKYFLTIYPVLLIVLSPVLYRMARLMWINFFIRYKKDE